MNLKRIFANAVARRVAFVLVAAAFAWLGIGSARAVDMAPCTALAVPKCDQGKAYAEALAYGGIPEFCGGFNTLLTKTAILTGGNRYTVAATCRRNADGYVGYFHNNTRTWFFDTTQTCGNRANYTGPPPTSTAAGVPVQGALSCMNGCNAAWFNNGDGTWTGDYQNVMCTSDWLKENCAAAGTGYAWNAYAGLCQPPKAKCEANQTKDSVTGECKDSCPAGMVMDATGVCDAAEDDCPAGNVKAPSGECLPGEGQCAAGEARRPNGTCGKDSDGDGEADEDDEDPENDPEKETASGGDSCDAPPSCSGGAIACMQVKIQWRIDCNTRKEMNISGGNCAAMPVCAGKSCNAMEYSQLIQQWKAGCALEKLANASTGGGSGSDADIAAIRATLTGSTQGDAGSEGNPSDAWQEGEGEEFTPDTSGYGYGGTCPSIPPINVMGNAITIDIGPLCQWVGLAGNIVLALAALASLRIVASREA